ncbi:PTS sugar transporter subunit IIA [Francisella frigiditurris]|uniref:Phosphoenolpyruvate-dependent sugar phosphotransferase system, EIIA 2 family protein n=1 Tax=Francisella frigiditurris TaxID=1542390 RepID=A0A1J0KVQ9_9GAMM|nr:PTS sugar transporter subunit IIA [Francisella frigiditurris]APC97791.1 phosphoenolpyruvate-dependent sugar phosphotransferase system, EIIA 2 family protein [Francisella frigiditurris]
MNLKALLEKKNIILNLNIESKKRLIEFLASRLADTSNNVLEDDVIKSIYDRERLGNTYIGKKIYMPHCRVEGLISTKIIITTLKNQYYDYQAKENIEMVVAVFFPKKITSVHIELLKELASFLKKEKTQIKLEKIKAAEEFYSLMIGDKESEL